MKRRRVAGTVDGWFAKYLDRDFGYADEAAETAEKSAAREDSVRVKVRLYAVAAALHAEQVSRLVQDVERAETVGDVIDANAGAAEHARDARRCAETCAELAATLEPFDAAAWGDVARAWREAAAAAAFDQDATAAAEKARDRRLSR